MSETQSYPVQPVEPAPIASVDADIQCRKCSYNLRGLPIDGRCPECGTPVGVSVNGDLLRYSDPKYVYTLRKGISLILWGILALIVVPVMASLLLAAHIIAPDAAYMQVLGFIAAVPMVLGGWLLTTPDPGGIGEDRYGTSRKIIRVCLSIGILNHLISFVAASAGPLAPSARLAFQTLEFAVQFCGLIGTFAQLSYLAKLAMRIPDPPLARHAKSIMWGLGVSYGTLIVVGFSVVLMTGFSPLRPSSGGFMAFGCAVGIAGLVVLIYAIMYLLMLFGFGRKFEEQAVLARAAWSHAEGGDAPLPSA